MIKNWFIWWSSSASDPDPDPYRVWKLGGITVKVGVEAHPGDTEGLYADLHHFAEDLAHM